MTDARVVLVTVPERDTAVRICKTLLEEGLVACGNIVPAVTSIYRWEGETKEDSELLLVLKTDRHCVPRLLTRIEEIHPYDVPEVLALPVESGAPAYLNWISRETRPTP